VEESCEYGDEMSSSVKGGERFDELSNSVLLKTNTPS
jgi:hypothetical protein